MSSRKNLDAYFINIAEVVSTRSTCNRKNVGSVIVVDKHIVSAGYNGAPAGLPHCDEAGHELKMLGDRESCIRAVHSEANAIAHAARRGVKIDGASMYCTASPCYDCFKLMINAGIKKIVCKEVYQSRFGMSDDIFALAGRLGIEIYFNDGK